MGGALPGTMGDVSTGVGMQGVNISPSGFFSSNQPLINSGSSANPLVPTYSPTYLWSGLTNAQVNAGVAPTAGPLTLPSDLQFGAIQGTPFQLNIPTSEIVGQTSNTSNLTMLDGFNAEFAYVDTVFKDGNIPTTITQDQRSALAQADITQYNNIVSAHPSGRQMLNVGVPFQIGSVNPTDIVNTDLGQTIDYGGPSFIKALTGLQSDASMVEGWANLNTQIKPIGITNVTGAGPSTTTTIKPLASAESPTPPAVLPVTQAPVTTYARVKNGGSPSNINGLNQAANSLTQYNQGRSLLGT